MLHKRSILKDAYRLSEFRPKADLNIEQYLMTPESMTRQVVELAELFSNRRVFHLGDDDHLSVLFAEHLNSVPIVLEFDKRIRESLAQLYADKSIDSYRLEEYDARRKIPNNINADVFYINPPYSSKNGGKGAKVWLSRAVKTVPVGSTSVLVYPIDERLDWTLSCMQSIIEYAHKCGLVVVGLKRDLHTYGYLPNDPALLSSNIYFYKYTEVEPPIVEDIDSESLYR
jgi:predicted methyltransferase